MCVDRQKKSKFAQTILTNRGIGKKKNNNNDNNEGRKKRKSYWGGG